LATQFRDAIHAIYGFVRFADEIVDSFHAFDKRALLDAFVNDTYRAISARISTNPILHSFQLVVNRYNIGSDLIDAFLKSMEMDLYRTGYDGRGIGEYIYGSAEVVGLMCLKVFCNGDLAQYERLREPASKLGAAFQKVNFLRDIRADYYELGRVYFPGIDFTHLAASRRSKSRKGYRMTSTRHSPAFFSSTGCPLRGVFGLPVLPEAIRTNTAGCTKRVAIAPVPDFKFHETPPAGRVLPEASGWVVLERES
jgi:phytoene/squalene synthetase